MAQIKLIVGSKNPVKIAAVHQAFAKVFHQHIISSEGVSCDSGVAEQPMTWRETRQGAINRVEQLKAQHQADYCVAIEGGVDHFEDGPATFAFVVISCGDRQSVGRSAQLPLPFSVYQALVDGEELGTVMDQLFDMENAKQKQGAIGLLTANQESRTSAYVQATTLALAPFINPQLYP